MGAELLVRRPRRFRSPVVLPQNQRDEIRALQRLREAEPCRFDQLVLPQNQADAKSGRWQPRGLRSSRIGAGWFGSRTTRKVGVKRMTIPSEALDAKLLPWQPPSVPTTRAPVRASGI